LRQVGKLERRERLLRRIRRRINKKLVGVNFAIESRVCKASRKGKRVSIGAAEDEDLPNVSPDEHHQMSLNNRDYVDIPSWLREFRSDPAFKVSNNLN
jgi:hypothetical protein